jgi:hypothetical protein
MKNKTALLQEQLIIFSSIREMKLDDIQKELGEFVASGNGRVEWLWRYQKNGKFLKKS